MIYIYINRLIILKSDITNGKILTMQFNKKPKDWYLLIDPNSSSFIYEKIKINNLVNGEM